MLEVGFEVALAQVQVQGRVLVGGRARAMVPVPVYEPETKQRDQGQVR